MKTPPDIKYLSVKEFRELGFLQEVNRQILHPLGLALVVVRDAGGNERFGKVWDCRDDREGITFDPGPSSNKASAVETERFRHVEARQKLLGGRSVQPCEPEQS